MARLTLVQAVNDALRTAMRLDERVVVLGEDVGKNGGVFRATEGLLEEFGEQRALDTPLAESVIVGAAIGMAAFGLRPVPEIQFMGFLYPALDQLAGQAARLRTRSAGTFHVPMVVRCPYGGLVRSPELHSDSLEALCAHSAGLKVVTPSTPHDAKGLLLAAIEDPDPVVFMEPLRLYRSAREEVPEGRYTVPLGELRLARPGRDVTLVAWGSLVPSALAAAEQVAGEGIEAEVLDLRTLSPLDADGILASVARTHRLVVVQEAPRSVGVAAEVCALVAEEGIYDLEGPPIRVTGYDTPYPLPPAERSYVPSVRRIAAALRRVMAP
jgi:pyruvate dehydrogenase E1 component beta subunit